LCIDGPIHDDELTLWGAAPLDVSVALTCSHVRAAFWGPCLARGIALLDFSPVQLVRLFPQRKQRDTARRLRCIATRVRGERARTVLAYLSWNELQAAALHDDEEAQIQAALAYVVRSRSRQQP